MPEDPSPFELAKLGYTEVLDATKHQDDKIGRTLGAIAFFTGGVIAFLDRDVVSVRHQFGTRSIPLIAIALGAFLVLAACSALLFVLASSSPLTLPKRRGATDGQSHLFFLVAASMDDEQWTKSWAKDDVGMAIRDEMVAEAHNIAKRAADKYRRSQEAAALLLIGMPFFVATVLLAVDANAVTAASVRVDWTLFRRILVGVAFGVLAFVFAYFDAAKSKSDARQAMMFYPAFTTLVIASSNHPVSVLTVLAAGLLATDAFQSAFRLEGRPTRRTYVVGAAGLIVTGVACWAVATQRGLVQLAIGTLALTLLPMQTLLLAVWTVLTQRSTTVNHSLVGSLGRKLARRPA